MNPIVSTIVAGAVALSSAMLSAVIALYSIRQNSKNDQRTRSHSIAVALLPIRVEALQATWKYLLDIESGIKVPQAETDQLVVSSMWLPPSLRQELLTAILDPEPGKEQLNQIRAHILHAAATSEVDVALSRLSSDREKVK